MKINKRIFSRPCTSYCFLRFKCGYFAGSAFCHEFCAFMTGLVVDCKLCCNTHRLPMRQRIQYAREYNAGKGTQCAKGNTMCVNDIMCASDTMKWICKCKRHRRYTARDTQVRLTATGEKSVAIQPIGAPVSDCGQYNRNYPVILF